MKSDGIAAEAEQVPEGEKRFDVPNPPTWDYRLKQRGGSTYLIPPVGQAFTPETRRALRDWARDAGYFASIITGNEISIAAVTGGPPLDYIVDGVKEQAYGRQVDKERAAGIEHNGTHQVGRGSRDPICRGVRRQQGHALRGYEVPGLNELLDRNTENL